VWLGFVSIGLLNGQQFAGNRGLGAQALLQPAWKS